MLKIITFWHATPMGIKRALCHWNRGGSYLINSRNEIEQVIDQYRPHIFGISESNFYSKHNIDDVQIDRHIKESRFEY